MESGEYEGDFPDKIVEETLIPILNKGMDTLILGCTHYPLLKDSIQKAVGSRTEIISSGDETAREVSTILDYKKLLNRKNINEQNHLFLTTGPKELFQKIASRLFEQSIENVETIVLE